MPKKMTWKEAILLILRERKEPVHYAELADEALRRKLVESDTATPANTVYTACLTEMRRNRPEISRVGKGLFTLTEAQNEDQASLPTEDSWLQSLGVLWRRDWVRWATVPKLLGIAPNGLKAVDFADQRGVYILYDAARPVYVGRATDRGLGKRLSEHVTDRLGARWDRFSWFGLRAVTEAGALESMPDSHCTADIFIADLEAILIEALETPLNRRRGDDLDAKEFQQVRDETLEKQKLRDAVEAILHRAPE